MLLLQRSKFSNKLLISGLGKAISCIKKNQFLYDDQHINARFTDLSLYIHTNLNTFKSLNPLTWTSFILVGIEHNDRVTSSSSGWFPTRFSMSFVSCSQLSADNLLCRLGGSDLLDLVYFRFFWKWNQLELRHLCISVLPVNWCASHQQKLLFLIIILLY